MAEDAPEGGRSRYRLRWNVIGRLLVAAGALYVLIWIATVMVNTTWITPTDEPIYRIKQVPISIPLTPTTPSSPPPSDAPNTPPR